MFSSKEAMTTDEVRPVKTEMTVSSAESWTQVPRQLPHGDLPATFVTLRTHPPAFTEKPRIIIPDCSSDMTDLVLSSTKNEADVPYQVRANSVFSFSDNETDKFLTTREVSPDSRKQTKVCSFSAKEAVVPHHGWTNPVLSFPENKADKDCSRTDSTPQQSREFSPASRTFPAHNNKAKICCLRTDILLVYSFSEEEADNLRQRTDNLGSSSTNKETEEVDLAEIKMQLDTSEAMDFYKCSEKPLKRIKEDFDLNFQHLGASATRMSIMLINKEGEGIADSAPPVEYNHTVTTTRSFPFPPLDVRHTGQAAIHSSLDKIQ